MDCICPHHPYYYPSGYLRGKLAAHRDSKEMICKHNLQLQYSISLDCTIHVRSIINWYVFKFSALLRFTVYLLYIITAYSNVYGAYNIFMCIVHVLFECLACTNKDTVWNISSKQQNLPETSGVNAARMGCNSSFQKGVNAIWMLVE